MYTESSKFWLSRWLIVVFLIVVLLGSVNSASARKPEVAVFLASTSLMAFWDPSESIGDESFVFMSTYETLLRYDPFTGKFEHILAESHKKSEGGKTWTFQIRKGVKFHTGGELDAHAVKFSIERTMNLKNGAYYIWSDVDSIEVPDKYTVVFNLKHPFPLDIVVASCYGAAIFDPDYADRDWFYEGGHDSGTGPYMIESNKGNVEVVITKFDEYWGGWDGKHFDKVVFKLVAESGTRRLMLESGTADITRELPVSMIEAMEKNTSIEIVKTSSFENLNAQFNMAKSKDHPISNPFVRKALAYALPYEDILKGVLENYGNQGRGCVPKNLWGYSEKIKQYTHSLETAKFYLAKAGYPNGGIKLLLIYAADAYQQRVAELWKAELAKLNVELEVRRMPFEVMTTMGHRSNPNDRQDIFFIKWWPDFAHPHSFLSGLYETMEPPIYNFSYYNNSLFDDLMNAARVKSGTDREEAIKMYAEAQNILMEDCVGISIYDVYYIRPKRVSLKGFIENPAYPNVIFWYDCYREGK